MRDHVNAEAELAKQPKASKPSNVLILSPSAPLASARHYLRREHTRDGVRTAHHLQGLFYIWHDGIYQITPIEELRADLYRFLERAKQQVGKDGEKLAPFDPNKAKVANVLEATAAAAQLSGLRKTPCWLDDAKRNPATEYIACTNGLLHFPTRTLLPHTPALFTVNGLDYPYDDAAPEPVQWVKFMHDLWPNDQESINALQELFGLALTADTSFHKAFLLVGPKRSGKGTIARVLTQMIGHANVCGPTLASLCTQFGLQPLIGKRLAIVSDVRLGERLDQSVMTERLLAMTGGDSVSCPRKYLDAWEGYLETRFLMLSNELPRLNDASGALASRFITLILTNSFYGKEDHTLTEKLLAELPGILRWSLVGLDRLRKRGRFVPPKSSEEAQQELETLGSPIKAFLADRCEIGAGKVVGVDDLFGAWRIWCMHQNIDRAGTVQAFGSSMRAAVTGLKIVQSRDTAGKPRIRQYHGVRLN